MARGSPLSAFSRKRISSACCVETVRGLPSWVSRMEVVSVFLTSVLKLRTVAGRPFGLPDSPALKRVSLGGRQYPTS